MEKNQDRILTDKKSLDAQSGAFGEVVVQWLDLSMLVKEVNLNCIEDFVVAVLVNLGRHRWQ